MLLDKVSGYSTLSKYLLLNEEQALFYQKCRRLTPTIWVEVSFVRNLHHFNIIFYLVSLLCYFEVK